MRQAPPETSRHGFRVRKPAGASPDAVFSGIPARCRVVRGANAGHDTGRGFTHPTPRPGADHSAAGSVSTLMTGSMAFSSSSLRWQAMTWLSPMSLNGGTCESHLPGIM